MYDAALMLPALFYAMKYVSEPWRTRLVVAAYLLAAAWMPLALLTKFNSLALVTLCGIALCAAELYAMRPPPVHLRPRPQAKTLGHAPCAIYVAGAAPGSASGFIPAATFAGSTDREMPPPATNARPYNAATNIRRSR